MNDVENLFHVHTGHSLSSPDHLKNEVVFLLLSCKRLLDPTPGRVNISSQAVVCPVIFLAVLVLILPVPVYNLELVA